MAEGWIPDGPDVVPPKGYIRIQDQHGNRFWISPAQIQPGPLRRSELTPEQVARIARFKGALAEQDPTTLDQACENFMRDADPDKEIGIFERIAATYAAEVASRNQPSAAERKLLYRAILQCSWSSSLGELLESNPGLKSLPDLERVFTRYSAGTT